MSWNFKKFALYNRNKLSKLNHECDYIILTPNLFYFPTDRHNDLQSNACDNMPFKNGVPTLYELEK